ncbi:tetratricopeptide repeat protein [Oribacterium sp. FC2011]|uniref:tetratricopeptide repeat protein n=1 Tax=Oribacterium sp. FC2011 TaxID=1408311 RepID=UPI0004E28D47|nr:tetratricopeptide repeat protein [Oribacterium sp. FC2011]
MEKKSSPFIIIFALTGILLAALVGILVYFNLPAQRIRRMLKTAHKYIAEENYDEAILTLQKMLEIDPKNEDIYILLADTYEKNGDIDKEVEFLQDAVTLMPENQKISDVLVDVYPEVTLSEGSGTYTDPVTLSMSSSEGGEIFYKVSGSDNESKYSSPIELGKNGKYTIEYYAVSKTGYEGEHKTATYVINLDESKYHFNEWLDEADGRHYYDENGVSVTGWLKLKEKWYLFDGRGVMLTGFREDNGNTYYLRTDGIMVIGWQDINGKRYFFDENGAMLKNQWIDNTFYVGADGAMLVDTVTPDGKKVGKDGKKISDIEAMKMAAIESYRSAIENNTWNSGGIKADEFALIDIDGDGIMEISVYTDTSALSSGMSSCCNALLYYSENRLKSEDFNSFDDHYNNICIDSVDIDRKYIATRSIRIKDYCHVYSFDKCSGTNEIDAWCNTYINDDPNDEISNYNIAKYEQYGQNLYYLNYVEATTENINYYLSGSGITTGIGGKKI